jgi:hypothetical protein
MWPNSQTSAILLDFLRFKLRVGQQPTVVNVFFPPRPGKKTAENGANAQ